MKRTGDALDRLFGLFTKPTHGMFNDDYISTLKNKKDIAKTMKAAAQNKEEHDRMDRIIQLFDENKRNNLKNLIDGFRNVFNRIRLPYYSDKERGEIESKKLLPNLRDSQWTQKLLEDMTNRQTLQAYITM